jgi:co-chaperonin GroES (HSP10)
MSTGNIHSFEPEQLRPLHDRVLVRELPLPGNLQLVREDPNSIDGRKDGPGDYRRLPRRGIVVSVGRGAWITPDFFRPTTVRPGQIITFSSWQDWEDAPQGYWLIREADVWFVHSANGKQAQKRCS